MIIILTDYKPKQTQQGMLIIKKYSIALEVQKPLIFTTYPGFYLRNALIKALAANCHERIRVKDQKVLSCIGCSRAGNCLYRKLNLPVEKPEGIPGPMPFSLDVSGLHTGKYQSGILQFGLTLYGRAGHYLPLFTAALESVGHEYGLGEQGQAGQFSLEGCEKVAETNIFDLFDSNSAECSGVILAFSHLKLPPARMDAGEYLPFEYLLQQIQGRIHSLTESFGGDTGRLPLPVITPEQHGSIQHSEQFALCNYQYTGSGQGHWFLSGQVKYQGDLTPWHNCLKAGRMLGIGRFTSYGFGTYTLEK